MKVDTGNIVGVSRRELLAALQESLGLQAHYAELLNIHDGGRRLVFRSVSEWIHRLREVVKTVNI